MEDKKTKGVNHEYDENGQVINAYGQETDIINDNSLENNYVLIDGMKVPREEVTFDEEGNPVRITRDNEITKPEKEEEDIDR